MDAGSAVVLAGGARTPSVCFKWLGRHDSAPKNWGAGSGQPYPARVRLKSVDGRLGEVRNLVEIPTVPAGRRGKFTPFLLEEDTSAFVRKGRWKLWAGNWIPPATF